MADACNTHTTHTHKMVSATTPFFPLSPPRHTYILQYNAMPWFLLWIVEPSISFLAIFRIFHKSVFRTLTHSVYGLLGLCVCGVIWGSRQTPVHIDYNKFAVAIRSELSPGLRKERKKKNKQKTWLYNWYMCVRVWVSALACVCRLLLIFLLCKILPRSIKDPLGILKYDLV